MFRGAALAAIITGFGSLIGCPEQPTQGPPLNVPEVKPLPNKTPPGVPQSLRVPWNKINTWGIQYQGFDQSGLEQLRNTQLDLSVIGVRYNRAWTQAEINSVRQNKWLLAYISAGSIGTHEPRWKSGYKPGNPNWIIAENTWFPGTYSVKYWDSEYQKTVLDELDTIIDAGFDGAFIDQLDAYYNPGFPGGPSAENVKRAMELGCLMGRYAKSRKPDFRLVVNNAIEHLDTRKYPSNQISAYLGCIDDVVIEHFWYKADDQPETKEFQSYIYPLLKQYQRGGGRLFSVDFTSATARKNQVIDDARKEGWIPFVGLGALNRTPGPCDSLSKSALTSACVGR